MLLLLLPPPPPLLLHLILQLRNTLTDDGRGLNQPLNVTQPLNDTQWLLWSPDSPASDAVRARLMLQINQPVTLGFAAPVASDLGVEACACQGGDDNDRADAFDEDRSCSHLDACHDPTEEGGSGLCDLKVCPRPVPPPPPPSVSHWPI